MKRWDRMRSDAAMEKAAKGEKKQDPRAEKEEGEEEKEGASGED